MFRKNISEKDMIDMADYFEDLYDNNYYRSTKDQMKYLVKDVSHVFSKTFRRISKKETYNSIIIGQYLKLKR